MIYLPAILSEQAWSIYMEKDHFSFGTQRVIPNWKDDAILPARVANQSAEFRLPAYTVSYMTKGLLSRFPFSC